MSADPRRESAVQANESTRAGPDRRRLVVAVSASLVALAAAVVAAVGPAKGESSEYSWPPSVLPAETPDRGWYAPLPLLNRVPASIVLRVPCGLAPPLVRDGQVRVLATARRPRQAGAFWIEQASDSLRAGVGTSELAAVPWPASCPLHLEVTEGELRLPDRVVPLDTGALDDMPIVTGLFTTLDLGAGEPPDVVVRTRTYATSQTARQSVAAALGAALALFALVFIAEPRRRVRRLSLGRGLRAAWDARDPTDAVVVGMLLVWWIVAPALTDDGWIWAQYRLLSEHAVDSIYLNNWGLTFPLGYWLIWLGQWPIGLSTDLVFMRVPSLVVLLATWPVCRWCLSGTLREGPQAVVRWMLAAAFLVGATAWLMTLRFEPVIALMALASLKAMLMFVRAPQIISPVIVALLAVLALTAHPVGLVVFAPLLAAGPQLLRWLRAGGPLLLAASVPILVSALALALILLTVDADLPTRLDSARLVGGEELHREPWWREYIRYTRFDQFGGETAVRRLSLALLLLSVAGWVARSRTPHTSVPTLPARSLGVALVLLAFVSSKWPWHFGALAAVGAVAAAAELARLVREHEQGARGVVRPLVAAILLAVVVLWSWDADGEWSKIDLQETRWSYGFGIGGLTWWLAVPLVLVGVAVLALRRRRLPLIIGWTATAATFAAVALTAGLLGYDAAVSSWTATRQNLGVLAGREACGLADQLSGESEVERMNADGVPTLLTPAVGVFFPCATIPRVDGGLIEIPRFVVFESSLGAWPLFTPHGPFAAVGDLYQVRMAASAHGVHVLVVADEVQGLARAHAARNDSAGARP